MSTPITDRAAIALKQIDARIAAIAGNWPDESRALRCLKTAIEGLLEITTVEGPMRVWANDTIATICDTWEAGR